MMGLFRALARKKAVHKGHKGGAKITKVFEVALFLRVLCAPFVTFVYLFSARLRGLEVRGQAQ